MRARSASFSVLHRVFASVVALAAALFLLGFFGSKAALAQSSHGQDKVTIIVKMAPGSEGDQADTIKRNGGTEKGRVDKLKLRMIEVPAQAADAILKKYQDDPNVTRAEKSKQRQTDRAPVDPLFGSQWALGKIGWTDVFGTMTPTGTATVAVLDTGINAAHPDLAGNVVAGTSILDGSSGMTDPNGHGTWVAGIVAARSDNGEGIAGVGFAGVRVMPVTVLNEDGLGDDADVVQGVVWAADNGANVILMAFSNPGFSESLQEAIDYAWARGVVIVAAAGNDAWSTPSFPAGDRGVIGVAATDENDQPALFSNEGQSVFMAAPGTNIQTTDRVGYTNMSGTSSSAAYVAGAAALLKAFNPSITNGIIVGRLARTADPAGTTGDTGNGRLNLARALNDTSIEGVQPAGADPVGSGGPFVGPYVAAAIQTVSVSPATIPAGSVNNNLQFNFKSQGSTASFTFTITVPSGWTAPSTTVGGAGEVTISNVVGCSTTPTRTVASGVITVTGGGCGNGDTFVVNYKLANAPATAQLSVFLMAGSGTANQTVTVANPVPTLTSINPTSGARNTTLDVVFIGTNFVSGATATIMGGGVTVNSTTVDNATQATVNVTISNTATLTARNVFISNAGPGGGASNTLANAFTILAAGSTFTINASAGANGSISPSGAVTVASGGSQTFSISPAVNYHAADVVVDTISQGALTSYTFSGVASNHTIAASFAINTYALSYSAGANGTISGTTPQTVAHGSSGTAVSAVPATGYHFVQWSDGSSANPRTDANVTANIAVSASFAINTYTLSYSAGANGTIGGTTPQPVNHGSSGTAVSAVPDAGYAFVQWSDGSTANPRTDANVTTDIAVSATFADLTPPDTSITSGPTSPTNATTAAFTFAGSDTATTPGNLTFECKLDGAAFAGCSSGVSYTGLAEGSHTFQVQAKDQAGNVDPTPATFTWSIDLTAPTVTIDSMPPATTNQTTATFAFHASEAGSSLECKLDAGNYAACTSTTTYNGLLEGSHTFSVRAKDAAGNLGDASNFTWVVDLTAPTESIETSPDSVTNSNTATFTFNSNDPGATFTCKLDDGIVQTCVSGQTYNGLAAGSHVFTVVATDAVGNSSAPATYEWLIDLQAPDTSITSGPADGSTTTITTATFEFTGTDNVSTPATLDFECSLDGAAFTSCTSPKEYAALSRTPHTFEVRAIDDAGNTDATPAARTWTITKIDQAITITQDAPATAAFNSEFTVTATGGASGNPITFGTVAGSVCSIQSSTVASAVVKMTSGTGTCQLTLNQAGNADYSAAPPKTTVQTAASKLEQAITITQDAPATADYDSTFTVTATGGASGNPISFAVVATSVCSVQSTTSTSATVKMTSGTGNCQLTLNQAGNANYSDAPPKLTVQTLAQKLNQAITITQDSPPNAFYSSEFTVTATGGASGNPITFGLVAGSVCSIQSSTAASAVVKMTSGTGNCQLTLSQAGNANYNPAPQKLSTQTIAQKLDQAITITQDAPASAFYNSTFTVTATGGASGNAISFAVVAASVCSIQSTTSTSATVKMTSGTGICQLTLDQSGNDNYNAAPQKSTVQTLAQKLDQAITITLDAPASADYNSEFTVNATGGGSGYAITFAVVPSSVCSIVGSSAVSATVKMTSGTGTCQLTLDQAGDANYNAAPQKSTQQVQAQKINPTVTFTGAPAEAPYQGTFVVASSTNSSASPVYSSNGACSNTGTTTYSMISGTGICTSRVDWATDQNYKAAYLTQSTTARKISPTVSLSAPATADFQSQFTPVPSTNASTSATITVDAGSVGVCSISSGIVTMNSGSGVCALTASWPTDDNYNAATAQSSTAALKIDPTVTFTGAPASAGYASAFIVASTTNSSASPVYSVASGVCSNSGATFTMNSGTGSCTSKVYWAADNNYKSATRTQTTAAFRLDPTVVATGNTCTYNASACLGSGSASGVLGESLPVSFTYKDSSSNVVASPVSADTYGLLVAFAGDLNYNPASTSATITVNKRPVKIRADAKAKFYKEPPPLPDPALTFSIISGSVVPGDGFSGSLTRAAGESVSSYAISQGSVTLGNNYQLDFEAGIFRIIDTTVSGNPMGPQAKGTVSKLTVMFPDTLSQATPTCSADWDDSGVPTVNVAMVSAGGFWTCILPHTYAQAGVYSPKVTVTDANTGSRLSTYEFFVVYDAGGGFVTGGGWIMSPKGAYKANGDLTGKATFGFVSKYQKGATVPTGETEFQFQTADFKFKSTSYEWLVVAGAKAQYKGFGSVNGVTGFSFLLTAYDGDGGPGNNTAGGPDRIRIKIMANGGGVVYDNNVNGAGDDIDLADPQAIGSGSIVVHK